MPTVILLDNSLSMLLPCSSEEKEAKTRRELAANALCSFLDQLSSACPLEWVALLQFSSSCEIVVPFTRDYGAVKVGIAAIETDDKTLLQRAVRGAGECLLAEFGPYAPCQVIVVTDGYPGANSDSEIQRDLGSPQFPIPSRLHTVIVASDDELCPRSRRIYSQLCAETCTNAGDLCVPSAPLTLFSLSHVFSGLIESYFSPYNGRLVCGHLSSEVSLFPPPFFPPPEQALARTAGVGLPAHTSQRSTSLLLPTTMEVCGFLEQSVVAGPPVLSRHLVLDARHVHPAENGDARPTVTRGSTSDHATTDDTDEEGRQASFRVLLHASLKVEGLVALVRFREDWFGMLMSAADHKKKANLSLSVFSPGCTLPWLSSRLDLLGPAALLRQNRGLSRKRRRSEDPEPILLDDVDDLNLADHFPVPPPFYPSFHQASGVVWARPQNLQTDVQRVLKFARRLPEKQTAFVREVNRVRHAALSYSLNQLTEVLSSLLRRECSALPKDSNPEINFILTHVATMLLRNSNPSEEISLPDIRSAGMPPGKAAGIATVDVSSPPPLEKL